MTDCSPKVPVQLFRDKPFEGLGALQASLRPHYPREHPLDCKRRAQDPILLLRMRATKDFPSIQEQIHKFSVDNTGDLSVLCDEDVLDAGLRVAQNKFLLIETFQLL
ncbi:hypothetical protein AWENTII_010566 [Aspergillus wentii]